MSGVSVKGISKKYRIFPKERDRLLEALSFGRREYGHDFWALKDVDLEVEPGTTLGILGRNGAGKTTLLNVIAGIVPATSGTVEADGRLIAVSAVGALGFNPEFTGRENILLNGMIMGLERREILDHFDDIAAFAEIGEFMDQPIKHYSTGMRSRLGFAVAVNVEPDILILDETLAAGDEAYKQAAQEKLYELRSSGTTTLFVSHSLDMVEDFCTAAVLLHKGRVMATGAPAEVVGEYQALTSSVRAQKRQQRAEDEQDAEQPAVPDGNGKAPQDSDQALLSGARRTRKNRQQTNGGEPPQEEEAMVSREEAQGEPAFKEDPDFERRVGRARSGTGEARIQGVDLLDERLRPVDALASGSTVTVRVYLKYLKAVKDSELVIAVRDQVGPEQPEGRTGSQFYGPNLGYVLDLYEEYKRDPESVDEETRVFFETWRPPKPAANGRPPAARELFSASTAMEGVALEEMGERVVVDFTFKVPVRKGRYGVSVCARAGAADTYLDRVENAATLKIKRARNRKPPRGALHLPTTIKVHTPEGRRQGRPA
jgi:ABC-2 type transport system ATP-binding protein